MARTNSNLNLSSVAALTSQDQRRATALAAISAWRSEATTWCAHIDLIPAVSSKPSRVQLRLAGLMAPPANGIATEPCTIETDPNPSARVLMMLARNQGVAAFRVLAENLADATGRIAVALEDFDFDNTRAVELGRSLRGAGQRPLVEHVEMIDDVHVEVDRLELRCQKAPSDSSAAPERTGRPSKQRLQHGDVLGAQNRTRLRRIALLNALPAQSNKDIVGQLDQFGEGGPDDGTVSKDIKAMRQAGAIHPTKLDLTAKGEKVAKLTS